MQGTRQEILDFFQKEGFASVNTLSENIQVAPGTIRHHLTILERDGLVIGETVRKQVGRPYHSYRLSPKGSESFPKKYDRLSSSLISEVKASFGPKGLHTLLDGIAQRFIVENVPPQEGRTIEERADLLLELFSKEGFATDWQKEKGRLMITQHACPYQSVVDEHPEVCHLDSELVCQVMGTEATRTAYRLDGDQMCTFEIELD